MSGNGKIANPPKRSAWSETIRAVSGVGLSDEVLRALASKGGLVGIHGGAAVVGKRYRKWLSENPEQAAANAKGLFDMVGYHPDFPRLPGDHGEYIARFDREFAERWRAAGNWKELPELVPLIPIADEWAAHVGGAGVLRAAITQVTPAAAADLLAQDRGWLTAQGIEWEPDDTT